MLETLARNENVKIEKCTEYLELLGTIVSVKFLDVAIFVNNRQDTWVRELLVSSIFENFKVFESDQIDFDISWFMVEQKFEYHNSCEILKIIQRSHFHSFAQIVELTAMLPELNFDEITRMLTVYGPEPYEGLKFEWCMKKVQAYASTVSGNYVRKLVKNLCFGFHVNIIKRMICCIKSLENMRVFEDIIEFCLSEKMDLNDIAFEQIPLTDLKLFITANHLCKCAKIQPENKIQEKSFLQIFQTLNKAGWNFVQLGELVTLFNPPKPFNRFQNLLHVLNTIRNYNLSSSSHFGKCKQILIDSKSF